jgi:hypothetical protein
LEIHEQQRYLISLFFFFFCEVKTIVGRLYSANRDKRYAYGILMGKSEGKRLLGKLRRRWVDNIKMDFGEIGTFGFHKMLEALE